MVRGLLIWGVLALAISSPSPGSAYPVGPAVPLSQIEEQSDLIVKATVDTIVPTTDDWFRPVMGFHCASARLHVISVLKGERVPPTVEFRFYEQDPVVKAMMYAPQSYHLRAGDAYLFFATAVKTAGIYRQLWASHTEKPDQGVIRSADARPVDLRLPLHRIVWDELIKFLASPSPSDTIYGIRQLSEMSGCSPSFALNPLHDFEADSVRAVIEPLIRSRSSEVALAAVSVLGARAPLLDDGWRSGWMTSLKGSQIQGFAPIELKSRNDGAARYWRSLAAVADDHGAPPEVRSKAIRALGQSRVAELFARIPAWRTDPQPSIRAAATELLGDYRDEPRATSLLTKATTDIDPGVRSAAAYGIAGGRYTALLPKLEKLLADPAASVRDASTEAVLSFPLETVKPMVERHVTAPDQNVAFTLALSAQNAGPYVSALARIIRQDLQPPRFHGGQIPAYTAWHALYNWLRQQPPESFVGASLVVCLDAMEHPKYFWSSSEPRDLYALYLVKGAKDRAAAFRKACQSTISYDMTPYFNAADSTPSVFVNSQ